MSNKFSVSKLIEVNSTLELVTSVGLDNEIKNRYPSRPVLEIYTQNGDLFGNERIQILGTREMTIFTQLDEEKQAKALDILFTKGVPCVIISRNYDAPQNFIEKSKETNITILKTDIPTANVVGNVSQTCCEYIKDSVDIHGIMMNIYGIGVLLLGESGIGKSETCLSLLKKGHQLISDDRVICNQIYPGYVIGESPELTQNYIELRGIGLVDVMKSLGASAISVPKVIELVVQLKPYKTANFERLGFDTRYYTIKDTKIPLYDIPVKSGRIISELVETAVLVFKQKQNGEDPAQDFIDRLKSHTTSK